MARLTYRQKATKANMIMNRLEKQGLENIESYQELQNDLEVFWNKKGKKAPTKSGISFNKNMTAQEKREMSKIVDKFLNAPRKTEQEIKEEYETKYDEYIDGLSPKNQEKKLKELENKSVSEMYNEMQKIERILYERKVIESLGSEIVKDIYKKQIPRIKANEELMTLALFNVVQDDYTFKFKKTDKPRTIDGLSHDELINVILKEYRKMVKENK